MKFRITLFDFIPTRVVCALMMFSACFVNYMMRVNISVNILAMVPDKPKPKESSAYELVVGNASSLDERPIRMRTEPDDSDTFTWTVTEQAYVLAGYFWGYASASFVGGTVAELYGPKKVICVTQMVGAIATILSPPMARAHYGGLVAMRLIIGLAAGFLFPALHALVARWAPPAEKGKFVSALLGGAIGTVFTWSLTGSVIIKFGWAFAFYSVGAIVAAWCFFWWFMVFDSPVLHPRIGETEKKYILESLGNKVEHGVKMVPPFKKIITSFPFICDVILHYGSDWGLYFVMTAAPKFLKSVLGFDLKAAGALASMPYLARMLFSMLFGVIGDKIVEHKWMSMTFMRKFFCLFSHVVPGILLGSIGFSTGSPMSCVMLITFCIGSNGAACLTNLVIHQDLSPNFAGTLFGIANGVGNTAGFITPIVTAHFTKEGLHTIEEWRPVFITGASLYIAVAIFFVAFGTAATQPWNYVHTKPEDIPATTK